MSTPPSDIPPQQLAELIEVMQAARDGLLQVSFLLRDYLDATDTTGREQAFDLAQALIRRTQVD